MFKINDIVIAKVDITKEPCDYSPGGIYAKEGEELIIRDINLKREYSYGVSHLDVTDSTFGVKVDEIKLKE